MSQIEIGLSSQGCCLTGAWSPEALIYPKTTNILKGEPQQMPKTYDFRLTFGEQTTKFPARSALLKQKWETFSHWL